MGRRKGRGGSSASEPKKLKKEDKSVDDKKKAVVKKPKAEKLEDNSKCEDISTLYNSRHNICYALSLLYVLRYSQKFTHLLCHNNEKIKNRNILNSLDHTSDGHKFAKMVAELHDLYHQMLTDEATARSKGRKKINKPIAKIHHEVIRLAMAKAFFDNTYQKTRQEDVQEFFTALLGGIKENGVYLNGLEDLNSPDYCDPRLVYTLFEGELIYSIKCNQCDTISANDATEFFNLTIVPDNNNDDNYHRLLFPVDELKVAENNGYACSVCPDKVDATTSVQYRALPDNLCIQIQRFKKKTYNINRKQYDIEKNFDHLPIAKNIQCFCMLCTEDKKHENYKLYAVIVHMGAAINAGHYVAYVKIDQNFNYDTCPHPLTTPAATNVTSTCNAGNCCKYSVRDVLIGKWVEFDDEKCTLISEEELFEKISTKPKSPLKPAASKSLKTPYLLFYKR